MAGEAHAAVAAVARQRVGHGAAERMLLLGGDELEQVVLGDVAAQVARLDKVVAGVDVAGVPEREGGTSCIFDPLRPAIDAVRTAMMEGIEVSMITGDRAITASATGAELGMAPGAIRAPRSPR